MAASLSQKLTEQLCTPQTASERHLDTLLQVSRAIGRIRDRRTLVDKIIHHTTHAFNADRTSLWLNDPTRNELAALVAQGMDDRLVEMRFASNHGIVGHVFQRHESLLINDAMQDNRFASGFAIRTGYMPRSMLVAPVDERPGHCAGVIQVLHHQPGYFCESDLALLEAIAVQIGISLENARLYEAQRAQFSSFVRTLSTALDARDALTAEHSVNVANYAQGIGAALGLADEDIQWLRVAGLLHDIGKIGTPEGILTKPDKLTVEEFDVMKDHAAQSRRILEQIQFVDSLADIPLWAPAHHEKLDGSGYPDGLTASQLPMKARILCVADIFDALTQVRHYRPGMDVPTALALIDSMTPHQLDPTCVKALKRFLGRAA